MKNNWWKQSWCEYSILVLIFSVAAMLRFYKLGDWSYWVDELYSLESSLNPYSENMSRPFWLITRVGLDIFGINAFALRLFPAVFGLLAIPLLYYPFKSIFNKRVAMLAIAFLAVSPWHIYLSQLARWYTLLLLVSTCSLISFYFFIERNSIPWLIASFLLFVFAFFLHLTAGFVVMIGLTYLFVLSRIPQLQPKDFSQKKVNLFFIAAVIVALAFIPEFLGFVNQWQEIKQQMGYWGSTPIDFSLKVLYHLTPGIAVVAFAGLLLIFNKRNRKGVFLLIYCLLPLLALNVAAFFETNVSAKYVFFTLPGLLIAASYVCNSIIEQLKNNRILIGLVIFAATILPSLQTDFIYFTSDHGNRNRLKEAVRFIKDRSQVNDQILLLYIFENPKEAKFYFNTIARLADFQIRNEQVIVPSKPEEIDSNNRIWVVTIAESIPSDATGLFKWVTDHSSLVAEFEANRGPEDNTVRVYLHRPRELTVKAEAVNKANIYVEVD